MRTVSFDSRVTGSASASASNGMKAAADPLSVVKLNAAYGLPSCRTTCSERGASPSVRPASGPVDHSCLPVAPSTARISNFESFCEISTRSEEHTSELQSREKLVCRLLLEKKKKKQ